MNEPTEEVRRGVSGLTPPPSGGRRASGVVDTSGAEGTNQDVGGKPIIFAAMPYDPAFDDVYFVAILAAARAVGGRAVRVDQVMHGGDAVAECLDLIADCAAVVADLSTSEPDVLYELGIAHALGKPSVQICSTEYSQLPFMVRNRETLLYQAGRTHALGQQLATYLATVTGR